MSAYPCRRPERTQSVDNIPSPGGLADVMRRNTLYAIMLLLAAIAVAGVLGVMRIYQLGG